MSVLRIIEQEWKTYNRGLTLELSEAEDGSSSMVEDMEESYSSAFDPLTAKIFTYRGASS
jgi:hypothetical protein